MSRILKSIGLVVIVFALSGCGRTIYNVDEKTISQLQVSKISATQVRDIIIKTAQNKGWEIEKVKSGLLSAKIKWNTHVAEIEILYSNKSYSINYLNSVNLIIDETQIHYRYNKLVTALEAAIDIAFDESIKP